jgi:4-oxalomesaconate tautomerase
MTQTPIRASLVRGGTSKGLYLQAADLPDDREVRDRVLLAAMGSPDPRQIDGVGGAHPLTSKVAVVSRSSRPDADVDYLFLQVWPDRAEVSDAQNCGNLLAGVGPYAIEEGLIEPTGPVTSVRVWMQNTRSLAICDVQTPGGRVRYDGDARIDGVPGSHAPISIEFVDVAGSSCGALLPTGNAVDVIDGVRVTCVDAGMPVLCIDAQELGLRGDESPAEIEGDPVTTARIEAIRLAAGPLMNLADVGDKTVPKVSLLAKPQHGGAVATRTLIPHRVHQAIGVLGAISVASACVLPGSTAARVAVLNAAGRARELGIEHPTGCLTVTVETETVDSAVAIRRAALLSTARLLMRGEVLVPASAWREPSDH